MGPWANLIFVADTQRGAALFQSRCSNCHTVQEGGPNKVGPNLHGVFGRSAGSLAGYNYSPAMLAAGVIWNDETLDAYLTNPGKDIPGDKMPFPGLPNKTDREDLIAYMHQATQ
jgi:cytochrome c